ncbi:hypothetical protein [Aliikangiella maris]|uniref:Beta-ketoacyl synthase N-terminal domain-containing protein n=2 Tax=Aliikangiella maris TaxID=3162458 RepID=A0ABV2BTY5_9GAMM
MNIYIAGVAPMVPGVKSVEDLVLYEHHQVANLSRENWFEPKLDLGGRGYKYFSLATQYMLAAIKKLPANRGEFTDSIDEVSKGIIIGSNSCTRQTLDQMDEAILTSGADGINPMLAPNFCANVGTGALSIKNRAKAFNITLMNPITAGLEAIIQAKTAIMTGRATYAITGSCEEDSEFYLANRIPVRTTGGACAVALSASKDENTIAQIGKTISLFLPPTTSNRDDFRQILHDALSPVLMGKNKINIALSRINEPHSNAVSEILLDIFAELGNPLTRGLIDSPEMKLGSLDAVLKLARRCHDEEDGLIVAISPAGQLSMIEIIKNVGEKNDD